MGVQLEDTAPAAVVGDACASATACVPVETVAKRGGGTAAAVSDDGVGIDKLVLAARCP